MEITEKRIVLKNGSSVLLGPVSDCDKECIQEAFSRLSDRSRYTRFHAPIRKLSDNYLDLLTQPDNMNNVVVAADAEIDDTHHGVGLARYVRLMDEPDVAEFSITVVDSWQGLGLGARMLQYLVEHAQENRIRLLRGYVLPSNEPMIRILKGYGSTIYREDDGTLRFDFDPKVKVTKQVVTA